MGVAVNRQGRRHPHPGGGVSTA